MPRSTGISTKHPHDTPNRSAIGCRRGRWSPPSRVRIRLPGSFPASRRRALTSLTSRMRADPSTNAFVSSAARCGGFGRLEGHGRRHARLERLERDPEVSTALVRRVGVGDLGRQRLAVVGPDHQRAAMLDRRAQVERGPRQLEGCVHLVGERVRLLAGEVAPDPTVDDLRPVGGGEVDAVREIAVAQVHADAQRLEDPAAGVLLVGVVAQDAEDADVGLGRDARPDGHDRARRAAAARARRGWGSPRPPAACGRRARGSGRRRARRGRRRAASSRRVLLVSPPAQRYFTIRANSSGSRLAPPTSAPSISGCAMNSRMLPGLTLPPYCTRTARATSSS